MLQYMCHHTQLKIHTYVAEELLFPVIYYTNKLNQRDQCPCSGSIDILAAIIISTFKKLQIDWQNDWKSCYLKL